MKTFYMVQIKGEMRPGIADVSWFDEPFNAYVITRINIPQTLRGNGYATHLLEQITTDADKEQVTLMLAPSPSDGLDFDSLVAWYERYDFAWTRSGAMMERKPQ